MTTLIDPIQGSVFDSGTLEVDQKVYISVKTSICYNGAHERKVLLYKNAVFDKLSFLMTNTGRNNTWC